MTSNVPAELLILLGAVGLVFADRMPQRCRLAAGALDRGQREIAIRSIGASCSGLPETAHGSPVAGACWRSTGAGHWPCWGIRPPGARFRPPFRGSLSPLTVSAGCNPAPISFPQAPAPISQNVTLTRPGLNTKEGATPNIARKVRVRCPESANPAR